MPAAYRENVANKLTFQHQPDAYLSQANPVSAVYYTVLPTTNNVRIIGMYANIIWAVTQPTPLEILVTIDGRTEIFYVNNPVTGGDYLAVLGYTDTNPLITSLTEQRGRAFLLEGRSVRVQVRVTWAVTQPTPLVCRVKWARR